MQLIGGLIVITKPSMRTKLDVISIYGYLHDIRMQHLHYILVSYAVTCLYSKWLQQDSKYIANMYKRKLKTGN